jgi:hypothetical protein
MQLNTHPITDPETLRLIRELETLLAARTEQGGR